MRELIVQMLDIQKFNLFQNNLWECDLLLKIQDREQDGHFPIFIFTWKKNQIFIDPQKKVYVESLLYMQKLVKFEKKKKK